jgi:hypothetical protein
MVPMRRLSPLLVTLALGALLGGCVTDERQWMKLDGHYTTADFTRDRKQCTKKDGNIDDTCMKDLGWVAVNPGGTVEAAKDPHARDLMPPSSRGAGTGGKY